jgi:drug/metabolite transporter (DMT)-like permease
MTASILLGLLGALLFAVSAAAQHHAAGVHGRDLSGAPPIDVTPGSRVKSGSGVETEAVPGPRPAAGPAEPPPAAGAVAVALEVRQGLAAAADATPTGARRRWPVRALILIGRLARDPLWLAGWVANVAGFGAQALALHLGSIVIVQALLVTQLLFALPLSALSSRRWPLRRDWFGTVAVCSGLVLLLTSRGPVPQTTARRLETWLVVCTAGALVLTLLLVSRLFRAQRQQYRTAAVAAAAGICFCLTAIFLVLIGAAIAQHGVVDGIIGWPLLGLCGSTGLGLVLVQDAYAGGSLPAAMTAMAITDPVASWIAGSILFDARPQVSAATLSGCVVAVGLIALGVAALANSPTLRDESRSPDTR